MQISLPQSIREEHDRLRQSAATVARAEGAAGEAARRVARLLEPHLQREEAFAFPPLGLLGALAEGHVVPEMAEALTYADWLNAHFADLRAEHEMIEAALEALMQAATVDNMPECVEFAERLLNHLRVEEQVLYPAARLVGQFLRVRLGRAAQVEARIPA